MELNSFTISLLCLDTFYLSFVIFSCYNKDIVPSVNIYFYFGTATENCLFNYHKLISKYFKSFINYIK